MVTELSGGAVIPTRCVGSTSCPTCHLHLGDFADRHREITDAGITEVVFAHSPVEKLRGCQSMRPFAVIADPDKVQHRIDPDGTLHALHYGRHANDQWSVDQLLSTYRSVGRKESS